MADFLREYDERKMIWVTTLDVLNRPAENRDGYATIQKTYDAEGNAIGDAYLDANGQPIGRRKASVERN